jgi:predicted phosphodiesterase
MRRVAAIYDIHGNLPALKAVLDDVRSAVVDLIVVGGDVVPGPMPRETLACLLDSDIPVQFVQGNGEVAVLAEMAGADSKVPDQFRRVVRWCADQLQPDYEQLLASWPKTRRLEVDGLGEILFCHATPRSDNEIFTRLTPDDCLVPVFDDTTASVIVCGHTHMQFVRVIGKVRVVNAGSVGMPYGKPGAYWLLLGPDIQLRCTRYDLTAAAERIRRTSYPDAKQFAGHDLLHPRSEREMLQLFSNIKLK